MFQICVIGCGAMSVSGHGPSFVRYQKEYPEVRLAGCCDLDAQKAQEYADNFGFERYYTDFEQMLHEIYPDVVSLVCPVQKTCELAVRVMEMGFPIILEKPPGLHSAETEKMLQAAQRAGVAVRTAFNRRYTPLLLRLWQLLRSDAGPIYSITYQMYRFQRLDPDFATTAIHAIDAAKYLIGSDYREVHFTYQEMPKLGKGVANYYLSCAFENGAVGQIALVPLGGAVCERVTVNTPSHTYFLELPFWGNFDAPGRLRKFSENRLIEEYDGSDANGEMYLESGFYEENRSFFELLRAGGYHECDLADTMQSVDIANCLRQRKAVYRRGEKDCNAAPG